MALHALFIVDILVCVHTVFLAIVFLQEHVCDNILKAMVRLGIEEIEGIVWSRKVAVHAVGNYAVFIKTVAGGLPVVIGGLDFMTRSAELRG
jgi:hypothetical protein